MELRNTNSQQTPVCDWTDAALEGTRVRGKTQTLVRSNQRVSQG